MSSAFLRHISVEPNDTSSKHYAASENVAANVIQVLFKGRIIFKQFFSKQHQYFGVNIYKLCDMPGYICDINTYFMKHMMHENSNVTPTHTSV
jgi:hypothetical protein